MAALRGAPTPLLGPEGPAGGAGRHMADCCLHVPRAARARLSQLPLPCALVPGGCANGSWLVICRLFSPTNTKCGATNKCDT